MAWDMDSRFAGAKMEGSPRLVIKRVLEGGDGVESWGRSERSRERFGERRRLRGGKGVIVRAAMGLVVCVERSAVSGNAAARLSLLSVPVGSQESARKLQTGSKKA